MTAQWLARTWPESDTYPDDGAERGDRLARRTRLLGFSVGAVAERTGIAKTTLYRHWRSRDDLLAVAIAEFGGIGPLPDTGSVHQDLQAVEDSAVLLTVSKAVQVRHP